MGCCDRRRMGQTPIPRPKTTSDQRIRISYAGGRPVIVRGPTTGVEYQFSGNQRIQDVDYRDAAVFLRSAYFRVVKRAPTPATERIS